MAGPVTGRWLSRRSDTQPQGSALATVSDRSPRITPPENLPSPVRSDQTAMTKADVDLLIGSAFIWHTGTTGILRGHAENISISGNWYERQVLIFESVEACAGQLHTYPLRLFVEALRPAAELVITGSGYESNVFGPFPADQYEGPLAAAYAAHKERARLRSREGWSAPQPHATPGTPEYGEYQRLTLEILRCTDIDRARKISARMDELRGGR